MGCHTLKFKPGKRARAMGSSPHVRRDAGTEIFSNCFAHPNAPKENRGALSGTGVDGFGRDRHSVRAVRGQKTGRPTSIIGVAKSAGGLLVQTGLYLELWATEIQAPTMLSWFCRRRFTCVP